VILKHNVFVCGLWYVFPRSLLIKTSFRKSYGLFKCELTKP
jgi:hypothetical protein